MSHPLKKARAVFPVEEYISEGEDDIEQDDLVGKTINVDFDAFKATDGDFHGIKRLLLQNLRGLDVDLSGLADIIISQNYVGSVVKQVEDSEDEEEDMDDADEIFGVSTIINLTKRSEEEPISKLRSALVEKCQKFGSDSTNTFVRESLSNESKHVGFVLSARLTNLPPQFAMPVYESLLKEISAANKKGMAFDFTYLVLISHIYKLKASRNMPKSEREHFADIMWGNVEEEIIEEESLMSFEYSVEGEEGLVGDDDYVQYMPWRKVLILDAKKLPAILCKIRKEIT